jgi:hypothetical protein
MITHTHGESYGETGKRLETRFLTVSRVGNRFLGLGMRILLHRFPVSTVSPFLEGIVDD